MGLEVPAALGVYKPRRPQSSPSSGWCRIIFTACRRCTTNASRASTAHGAPWSGRSAELAYTTVSSVLRLLEMKGYVAHKRGEGKTHVYYPVVDAETAGGLALGRLLDKIYGGSPIRMLAHLVEHRELSDAERERMRALLKGTPRKK